MSSDDRGRGLPPGAEDLRAFRPSDEPAIGRLSFDEAGMRMRHRQDGNHAAIRQAAERLGWLWEDCSQTTLGYDAIVTKAGRSVRLEIKDGTLPPSARQLTPHEATVHAQLKAHGVTVELLLSIDDLIILERPHPTRKDLS